MPSSPSVWSQTTCDQTAQRLALSGSNACTSAGDRGTIGTKIGISRPDGGRARAASSVSGSTLFVDGGWTAIDGPPTGSDGTRRGREIGMITTFYNTRLAPHRFNVSLCVGARGLGDRTRDRRRKPAPLMPVKNRNEGSGASKATVQGNAPSRNCASNDRLRTDANPRRHRPAVAW
jgi:hypothetical protein